MSLERSGLQHAHTLAPQGIPLRAKWFCGTKCQCNRLFVLPDTVSSLGPTAARPLREDSLTVAQTAHLQVAALLHPAALTWMQQRAHSAVP